MIEQILYKPVVVAALFGLNEHTVRLMCRSGRIPCVNLGSLVSPRWRIPLSFIEEAMRGEARWKYPKRFKRQCVSKKAALNRIVQAQEELNRVALQEKQWRMDEDAD